MSDEPDPGIEAVVRRGFYVGLAVLMSAFAVAGFWPTYWGPLFSGTLDLHWLLHLHGVVLTTWLLILITQAGLVHRGRTDLHMTLGKTVGVGGALLVCLTAVSAAFGVLSPEIGHEVESLQGYLRFTPAILGDVVTFAVLFVAGLLYRDRPAAHKRLMMLATAALLVPAGARLSRNVFSVESSVLSTVLGAGAPVLFALPLLAYDWRIRSRVHPATLFGGGFLFVAAFRFPLSRTDAWGEITTRMAESISSVLLPIL